MQKMHYYEDKLRSDDYDEDEDEEEDYNEVQEEYNADSIEDSPLLISKITGNQYY